MLNTLNITNLTQNNEKLRISYLVWSNNNTLNKNLLCLHGITRNNRDFDYLASNLSSHYTVICPDILGRGYSSWLENEMYYNYKVYCKSILLLIKELNIKKVDLLGTSMGGIIAMHLAAYYPNLIDKLVLNDIGPFIDLLPLKKIAKHILPSPIFYTLNEGTIYIKKLLCNFGISNELHWQHLIKHSLIKLNDNSYKLSVDPKISIAFNAEINKIKNMDFWYLWKKIVSKILIIRGQKSDVLTKNTLQKMLDSKNNIHYIEYPNIGHAPSLMENYQIIDIKNWLLG